MANLFLIASNFVKILVKHQSSSYDKNAFENAICRMAPILSWLNLGI